MFQDLGRVTLKTGESVEAGVIIAPDREWAKRLVDLLFHKGDPWNWQNTQILESDLGLDAFFYILHRSGVPFANIMTIELNGVGIFGHVWTVPEDRQKGASSSLMELQMQDFADRQGKALFLDTGPDSVAYHMYAKFGFEPVEEGSGYMAWYATNEVKFEASYFGQSPKESDIQIQSINWSHWPASPALFLGNFPGVVRCAPLSLIGRQSSESALLPALLRASSQTSTEKSSQVVVLQNQVTMAVVGLAAWDWHPIWPSTCLVDLYCHPDYWQYAHKLVDALNLPGADRYIAYGDASCQAKMEVLSAAGFRQTATFEDWVFADVAKTISINVELFEKSHYSVGSVK